jgi:hypothetical protein
VAVLLYKTVENPRPKHSLFPIAGKKKQQTPCLNFIKQSLCLPTTSEFPQLDLEKLLEDLCAMKGCKLSLCPSPLSCVGYDKSLTEFLCSAACQ